MLTNMVASAWETSTWYDLVFDDGHNNGFAFLCDENGNPKNLSLAAQENLEYCLQRPEKFVRFNEVVKHTRQHRVPGYGICKCGETVMLENQYMGACQCPKCGRWYNLFGQRLLPPEQWEIEDDEY